MHTTAAVTSSAAMDLMVRPALVGRTAIVTGSISGIGLGIARALAGQGTRVVLRSGRERGEITARKPTRCNGCVSVGRQVLDQSP